MGMLLHENHFLMKKSHEQTPDDLASRPQKFFVLLFSSLVCFFPLCLPYQLLFPLPSPRFWLRHQIFCFHKVGSLESWRWWTDFLVKAVSLPGCLLSVSWRACPQSTEKHMQPSLLVCHFIMNTNCTELLPLLLVNMLNTVCCVLRTEREITQPLWKQPKRTENWGPEKGMERAPERRWCWARVLKDQRSYICNKECTCYMCSQNLKAEGRLAEFGKC